MSYFLLIVLAFSIYRIVRGFRRRALDRVREQVSRRIDTLAIHYRDDPDRGSYRITRTQVAIHREKTTLFRTVRTDGISSHVTVHDQTTGTLLTLVGETAASGPWWVLLEEYAPGPTAHPADRKSRAETLITAKDAVSDRLRTFEHVAARQASAAVIVDPFQLPEPPVPAPALAPVPPVPEPAPAASPSKDGA
jgi:hypothetical protein